MHFRRHLEELRESDPVNVVATRGSVAFQGTDEHPCAIVFDGRRPSSLICLEAAPPSPEAALEQDSPGEITAIHVLHDTATLRAARTEQPPRFREPMDHPAPEV